MSPLIRTKRSKLETVSETEEHLHNYIIEDNPRPRPTKSQSEGTNLLKSSILVQTNTTTTTVSESGQDEEDEDDGEDGDDEDSEHESQLDDSLEVPLEYEPIQFDGTEDEDLMVEHIQVSFLLFFCFMPYKISRIYYMALVVNLIKYAFIIVKRGSKIGRS